MFVKLTATHDDGTIQEFDPGSTVIQPTKYTLRELGILDQIVQMMQGLNTNERKRILVWLSDRSVNVGVD